jgi:hypothetical protein
MNPKRRKSKQSFSRRAQVVVSADAPAAVTDLLILSDGTTLVHNLTPAMATLLNKLNRNDPTISPRARACHI